MDLVFGRSPEEASVTHAEYADKWKIAMKEAYSLALKNTPKSTTDGKRQYDRRVRFSKLQPGTGCWFEICLSVVDQGNSGRIGNRKYML